MVGFGKFNKEPSPAIKMEIRICHVNFLIRKFGDFLKFPNRKLRIQGKDIHRIIQTNTESLRSLSDARLAPNESQRLIEAITNCGDQYHIKFRDNTQVTDCIFYWDPTDVQFARRFSQVCLFHLNIVDGRFFRLILPLKTTLGGSHYLRLLLRLMK